MSELLVSTLWFEDVSFLNEQMLDTPVGRFSIRQMIIFLVFGLLAWIASLTFVDLVLKIVVAGAVFVTGAAFFARKTKTIPPETHLLHLVNRFLQTSKQKKSLTIKNKQPVEQTTKTTMLLSATLGVPVKVAGVLKDTSGKILSNKNFQVSANGTIHSNGVTDKEGYFCTYFTPNHTGHYEINIQPENHPKTTQKITIQTNPKKTQTQTKEKQTKEEDEVNQNAEEAKSKL